jgi:hypothetical protein
MDWVTQEMKSRNNNSADKSDLLIDLDPEVVGVLAAQHKFKVSCFLIANSASLPLF